MKRLKIILLCNYCLFILVIVLTIYRVNLNKTSTYVKKNNIIEGIVDRIEINTDKIKILIKSKEDINCFYYYNNNKEKNYLLKNIDLGDKIKVYGKLKTVNSSYKKTYNYIIINKLYLLRKNNNFIYYVRSKILKSKNPYIPLFILGDKTGINKDVMSKYRFLGISHLFAISGMHISLLVVMISFVLKKTKINNKLLFFIVSIFLVAYLFLTGLSASILRAVLFYILLSINKIYKISFKLIDIFILVISISLIINPFFIYDISFLYSFIISFALINYSTYINNCSYLYKLFLTSVIASLFSFPITVYNFNEINLFSVFYNIFYIPLVSILIFPIAILTYFIPILIPLLDLFTNILEISSSFLSNLKTNITFIKIPIFLYFIYYLVLIIFKNNKKVLLNFLAIFFSFYYFLPYFNNDSYLIALNVFQGDSILIHSRNDNILIDTGGSVDSNYSIVKNKTIPLLKEKGIKKIKSLVITHGDQDHCGEAINLVNNFKVEKVIFNCGPYNDLEKELIKVLNKKKIKYYSCIKELDIGNDKLYFLQTKEYDNENDNSNVIYTELNGYKFMFMGDASTTTEKEILDKYNLPDIDVLKVGHHGSKTSSSNEFINKINPKYSIISVGRNNRYGHPNKEVLENLQDSKIYRTDQDGSIMFKIKNNKLKIETCSP